MATQDLVREVTAIIEYDTLELCIPPVVHDEENPDILCAFMACKGSGVACSKCIIKVINAVKY